MPQLRSLSVKTLVFTKGTGFGPTAPGRHVHKLLFIGLIFNRCCVYYCGFVQKLHGATPFVHGCPWVALPRTLFVCSEGPRRIETTSATIRSAPWLVDSVGPWSCLMRLTAGSNQRRDGVSFAEPELRFVLVTFRTRGTRG